jgi:RimJ/RimL family protein N-acetyltransferase
MKNQVFNFILLVFLVWSGHSQAHDGSCKGLLQEKMQPTLQNTVPGDVAFLTDILMDPRVQEMGNRQASRELTVDMFRQLLYLARISEGVLQSIHVPGAASPVGFISMIPKMDDESVGLVGYALDPDFWNRGILTKALNEIVDSSFSGSRFLAIEAQVAVSNVSSQRVLEKAGFKRVEMKADTSLVFAVREENVYIYRIDKPKTSKSGLASWFSF